ncbi:MAG: hypothetical protein NWQ28_11920 [Nodularia sp. (in: cyanobacteria)]|nr:hypothetical protein [Nodularia sp. (in: cyanobacteria)]
MRFLHQLRYPIQRHLFVVVKQIGSAKQQVGVADSNLLWLFVISFELLFS